MEMLQLACRYASSALSTGRNSFYRVYDLQLLSLSLSFSLSFCLHFLPSCLAADVHRSSPENKVSDTVPNKSESVEAVASDAPTSPEPSGSQSRA